MKIKLCPFCDGTPEIISYEKRFYIFCCKMINHHRSYSTKQYALRTWNRRPK